MSLMHSVVFHFCKKGKRRCSPDVSQDCPAKRAAELWQNRFVRVVPYLHGGGFVVGSVKTRRIFTGCPPICCGHRSQRCCGTTASCF